MKKQINVNPCICVTAKKFDVLDWALKTWSNSIVFTIWGLFLVIVVFITIRVFLLLFLIIGLFVWVVWVVWFMFGGCVTF